MTSRKVMIVDDDESIRNFLKLHFENHDFQVILAINGASALILAQKEKPDLILLDMNMPVMPGWVAARELKKRGWATANIPVIAVTTQTADNDEAAARKAGCDDFVAKPIDVDKLFETVYGILD